MPYQGTPTLLTIPRWGEILGIHPLHLEQVDVSSVITSEVLCGQPVMQFDWQNNARTSRERIATVISTAEEMIKEQLGYAVLPEWVSEEQDLHDQLWRPELFPWAGTQAIRGMQRTQTLHDGYVIGGGQRAVTAISAGAAIVYSDVDGDGYSETATVGPIATTVTDANQIALFYRAADTPDGTAANDEWEIRPIRVTISGGFVTIKFRRELAVIFSKLLPLEPAAVDGSDNANFLTACDVYQRYTDPTTSLRAEWEPGPWVGCCGTTDGTCAACALSVALGCIVVHDERNSIVRIQPGTYDAATSSWSGGTWSYCRAPDRITAWYRAGFRDKGRARPYYDMDRTFEQAVTYLATSMLERPLCGCDNVAELTGSYRWDLANNTSNGAGSDSWQMSPGQLDNPFGTRRGAVMAWNLIEPRLLGRLARTA